MDILKTNYYIFLTFVFICDKIIYHYNVERTNIMKKTLSIILTLCMVLGLCSFSVAAAEATVGSVAADYKPAEGAVAVTNEAEFLAMVFQTHIAQDHYSVSHLYRVDNGDILTYISLSFKTFLALESRRG